MVPRGVSQTTTFEASFTWRPFLVSCTLPLSSTPSAPHLAPRQSKDNGNVTDRMHETIRAMSEAGHAQNRIPMARLT